jgi:hypothetical protein
LSFQAGVETGLTWIYQRGIDQLLIRRRGEEATEGVRPILADSHNHPEEVAPRGN